MTLWQKIQDEIKLTQEDSKRGSSQILLKNFHEKVFFSSPNLAAGVAAIISEILSLPRTIDRSDLEKILQEILSQTPLTNSLERDITAIFERDPACVAWHTTLLANKGLYALSLYRVAHVLIASGEEQLAFFLNMLSCRNFTIDIHPRARIASGIFIDHGNSIVIGETTVIDEDVSILQDVTLGGTGKETGDRHPKIRKGVLIGAGAKILGNVTIGEYSKIGAGSVVLQDIPAFATAVGVPARIINNTITADLMPAKEMDHRIGKTTVSNNKTTHPQNSSPHHGHKYLFSIDIGSNTIMMTSAVMTTLGALTASPQKKNSLGNPFVIQDGTWEYSDYIRFASLAEGIREQGFITEVASSRGENILREYQKIIKTTICHLSPEGSLPYELKVTATSALREAKNASHVQTKLEAALDAPITIISSEREAALTFLGTMGHKPDKSIIIDLGGGSTELSWGSHGKLLAHQGFSIGAISWKNAHPHKSLISTKARKELKKKLEQHIHDENLLKKHHHIPHTYRQNASLIGVAGIPTTLAALHYNYDEDHLLEVDGKTIGYSDLLKWEERIATTPLTTLIEDTQTWSPLNQHRAEIMLFSTVALRTFMDYLERDQLKVSIRGLRYGTLFELQTQIA